MKLYQLLPTILVKYFIRITYVISMLLFPVSSKKITIASYRAEGLTGNLEFIYKEFQKRDEEYTFSFLFKQYKRSFLGKLDYFLHMVKASYHLATSRYFIIDDYFFPVYVIKPRKGTEVVQLWHAAGAYKKFGHSTIGKTFGPSLEYLKHVMVHSNYGKVFVSSSEIIPFYAEAFHMSEKSILPLGVPRTDYFFQRENHRQVKEKLLKHYPKVEGKKIIHYAPTFRGKSHAQKAFTCPIDFNRLKEMVGEEYVLFIHLHPYMRSGMIIDEDMKDFVYHITGQFSIEELLLVTDILVTDFSSVIFDFSLLERPIAFFATDLEDYLKERDFYYPFESFIPGPFFTNTDELGQWIDKEDFNIDRIRQFRDRFFDYIDGKSSKRIVDYLIQSSTNEEKPLK